MTLSHYILQAEISRQLKIPPQKVSAFLQQFRKCDSIENLPHPGAPRKTTSTAERYIVHTADSNSRIPLAELRDKINCVISD